MVCHVLPTIDVLPATSRNPWPLSCWHCCLSVSVHSHLYNMHCRCHRQRYAGEMQQGVAEMDQELALFAIVSEVIGALRSNGGEFGQSLLLF